MEDTEMDEKIKVYSILRMIFSSNIWSGDMHMS